jgi:hypothetical protein
VTKDKERNMSGSDLRIYYGDARITLPHGDKRIQVILELVIKDFVPQNHGPMQVPSSDTDLLTMLKLYFERKATRQP